MSKSGFKAPSTLHTVEVLLAELEESINVFQRALGRFRQAKSAASDYREAASDLEIELFNLNLKSQHAHDAVEEFEDSLPDED